jgi:hypothetical protein
MNGTAAYNLRRYGWPHGFAKAPTGRLVHRTYRPGVNIEPPRHFEGYVRRRWIEESGITALSRDGSPQLAPAYLPGMRGVEHRGFAS